MIFFFAMIRKSSHLTLYRFWSVIKCLPWNSPVIWSRLLLSLPLICDIYSCLFFRIFIELICTILIGFFLLIIAWIQDNTFRMLIKFLFLLIFYGLIHSSQCGRYLFWPSNFHKSHPFTLKVLAEELAERGHDVTWVEHGFSPVCIP